MLKRQGVKRSHRVAQVIRGAHEAADYRAHVHPDIPDDEMPRSILGKMGAFVAQAFRDFISYFGFADGKRGLPFIRVQVGAELRALLPYIGTDLARPTDRGLCGREAYRVSRRHIRGRFKHRARYRKERMPVGFGLVPASLADLNDEMTEEDLSLHTRIMQEAALRSGILIPGGAQAVPLDEAGADYMRTVIMGD